VVEKGSPVPACLCSTAPVGRSDFCILMGLWFLLARSAGNWSVDAVRAGGDT